MILGCEEKIDNSVMADIITAVVSELLESWHRPEKPLLLQWHFSVYFFPL